jgi:CRP-like cAMP-binding protein
VGGWIKESFSFYELQRIMFKLINSVEVFAGFSQAELVELLSNAEKCTFQESATILSEGSCGNFMYILVEGEVEIVKKLDNGGTKVLARLAGGDCFGEMALVDSSVRSASVTAIGPCVLIRLSEGGFGQNPAVSAKLYRNIASQLSGRLRNSNAMISLRLKDNS